jgi:hypothetical protein
MKVGNIGGLISQLSEIPRRLKRFVTVDVRQNRILGLYLVIGIMVVGYAIYFVGVLYQDFTSEAEKPVASKSKVEKVKKAAPRSKAAPAKKKGSASKAAKVSPQKASPAPVDSETGKVAAEPKLAGGEELETSDWNKHEFKDGSSISFPADWSVSEIAPEKSIIHGIRLQSPSTEASFKCYGRVKQREMDIAESLKTTMNKTGYGEIKEEKKRINNSDVVRLSGNLADKHMVISIFDDPAGKYFIVSLVSSEGDYRKLKPYYTAVVGSYEGAKESSVSITKIEEELERTIEADKEYLVGTAIRIKLKSGSRHQGVVIAENDDSITLESYRFGGRYSFTVAKKDIVEIVR